MKILIAGGSGGIGLASIHTCLQRYPDAQIYASYRTTQPEFDHPRVHWHLLDINDEQSLADLAKTLGKIDILINAIGFLHSETKRPEKALKQFDVDFFQQNINSNTLPSILLAKHFSTSLKSDNNSYFVALSARIGSISDNRSGGWLSYRCSKAALNMALKTIAIEWQRTVPNCCVLLFHPGTTDTGFSKPFQKNLPCGQLHSAEVTANALLDLIADSTPADSGRFASFDGNDIDW
ncbi:SDR family NAD(P)-dependent oxidoreductase [Bacterioplanoides sp.]|uniref:SDR family NAD(P)-dependent oxidoreductase n=1 Tax=Bacterioplanoides sp. TaxID=2066072 RepID=UPI003B5B8ED1